MVKNLSMALGLLVFAASGSASAWAWGSAEDTRFLTPPPPCMDRGAVVAPNEAQVLGWEASTPTQFTARAHVRGFVTRLLPDHTGHRHFLIQIGPNAADLIEVVYNLSFGAMPLPAIGAPVEACGDYVTIAPRAAIIHWVHMAPAGANHDSGYVTVNQVLYGQTPGHLLWELQAEPALESAAP